LAKGICERANEDSEFPIPVLVNLSSWKGSSQLISDWLVGELKLKYGVKNDIGRKWVENAQLLPLLDGWMNWIAVFIYLAFMQLTNL
jgi:predicted NACHT family NTPase